MRYIKRFNESVSERDLVKVGLVHDLEVDDIVYYNQNGEFIKGTVEDDFGDGKFFIFSKRIDLGDGYRDNKFELYTGENPDIEKNLYKLK